MNITEAMHAWWAMNPEAQKRVNETISMRVKRTDVGYPASNDDVIWAVEAELFNPWNRSPPAARSAIEIIRAKGHTVTLRMQRTGSIRYRVDGGREMTCLQMTRKYREYGL